MEKAGAQAEVLLASGYLTNAFITVTNLPPTASDEKSSMAEISRRLRTGVRFDFYSFYVESNQAVITCRSKDLALVRTVIQNP